MKKRLICLEGAFDSDRASSADVMSNCLFISISCWSFIKRSFCGETMKASVNDGFVIKKKIKPRAFEVELEPAIKNQFTFLLLDRNFIIYCVAFTVASPKPPQPRYLCPRKKNWWQKLRSLSDGIKTACRTAKRISSRKNIIDFLRFQFERRNLQPNDSFLFAYPLGSYKNITQCRSSKTTRNKIPFRLPQGTLTSWIPTSSVFLILNR